MSKYIRLDDASKVLENTIRVMQGFEEPIERAIIDLPTIDIVTCDECKCWLGDSEWYEDREYRRCQNGGMFTAPNHYCAWGERIEE